MPSETLLEQPALQTKSASIDNPNPRRVLMCAPTAYALKYVINPWMNLENTPNLTLAAQQWNELRRTLSEEIGATVELVPQADNCPDMVFTANAGLTRGKQVILSNFKHPERQVEAPHYRAWFETNGYEVLTLPEDCKFEGEGDALFVGETLLAGYPRRSDLAAHSQIAELFSVSVISLELIDDRWYHLDTCLFPLDTERIVFYPGAFSAASCDKIRAHFTAFEINEAEALRFACNAVVIGNRAVIPSDCLNLTALLEAQGYGVYSVEMSEFLKAGGAAKCLTLLLR